MTARPATKALVTALYSWGRPCAAAPNAQNRPTRAYRDLCCTWYAGYVPVWHFMDGDVALPTEQARGGVRTAGVTPATTRTRDRRTEARQTALVLCTSAMASDHPHSREHASTHPLAPRSPADGQQGDGPPREGDGTMSWGLISPSRRMFSTVPAELSSCAYACLQSPQPPTPCQPRVLLKAPGGGLFLGFCAHSKTSPATHRAGGHRRVTWEDDGRLPSHEGNRPSDTS